MNNIAEIPKPPLLILSWRVLEQVIKTIGGLPAESGGAIGGSDGTDQVSAYHFDESSQNSHVTYTPDFKRLNHLFKTEWNPKGIRLRGFIHSHPGQMSCPSEEDKLYAERILQVIKDAKYLWLPIVNTEPDTGQFKLTPWAVYPDERRVAIVRGCVQIIHAPAFSTLEVGGENVLTSVRCDKPLQDITVGQPRRFLPERALLARSPTEEKGSNNQAGEKKVGQEKVTATTCASTQQSIDMSATFERVLDAYDLAIMRDSRIIAVGAGGAASWLEELDRAGLGQSVLIDPDVVSETNLATQQTYRRDIGRTKVDCIAERIRDINPSALVVSIQKSLNDMTDEEIRHLVLDPLAGRPTRRTILCGLTDDFYAQARINRLSLQLGVPSLSAQVWEKGRGAEITFTFPGVTPACHRCILSSRYHHFLEEGKKNDVTSHGTPIFATTRLNAIKGFVILAMLHHGSNHPRWGNMLSRIADRNLIKIRMDPDLAETMKMIAFNQVFEKADHERLFFDETIWVPQKQECPETGYPYRCPDCGGTGDLRNAIGKIKDTRLSPPGSGEISTGYHTTDIRALRALEAYRQNGGAR